MGTEDYTGILVCLLPENCTARQAARGEDASALDVIFAAHLAKECVEEELKRKGVLAASFQAFMMIACRMADQAPISSDIHDAVCGCQKKIAWSNRNERVLFTLANIDIHNLPTADKPWTNGDLTAWAKESGSRKRPVTDVRFYRNDAYVGSVTKAKGDVWKLYCLKGGKPHYPKGEFESFIEARDALVKEVS